MKRAASWPRSRNAPARSVRPRWPRLGEMSERYSNRSFSKEASPPLEEGTPKAGVVTHTETFQQTLTTPSAPVGRVHPSSRGGDTLALCRVDP